MCRPDAREAMGCQSLRLRNSGLLCQTSPGPAFIPAKTMTFTVNQFGTTAAAAQAAQAANGNTASAAANAVGAQAQQQGNQGLAPAG